MFLGKPAALASSQTMTIRSGSWVRQRSQQHRLDEREDRGVGADAERQRAYRRDGEDRRLSQEAHGVSQVGEKVHGALDGGR